MPINKEFQAISYFLYWEVGVLFRRDALGTAA